MPLAATEESLALRIKLSTLSPFSLELHCGLLYSCDRSRLSNVPPAAAAVRCQSAGNCCPDSGCTNAAIVGFFMINTPEVVSLY